MSREPETFKGSYALLWYPPPDRPDLYQGEMEYFSDANLKLYKLKAWTLALSGYKCEWFGYNAGAYRRMPEPGAERYEKSGLYWSVELLKY